MYHDLNVCVPPEARPKALETLARLGYDVVAFTTTLKDEKKLTEEYLPRRGYEEGKKPNTRHLTQFHTDPKKRGREMTVLERITVVIDDNSQLGVLSSTNLNQFDLVAVRPSTEKLLQQCLQFDIDIVSLTLDRRQMFHLKRPQVHVAVEKGVVFELDYGIGLRDTESRRLLIGNGGSICRATGGKHIILSSGARNAMELRGPHDVINLGILFGINQEHSHNAVTRSGEATVIHGDTRARVHKGIVRVEKVESLDQPQDAEGDMND